MRKPFGWLSGVLGGFLISRVLTRRRSAGGTLASTLAPVGDDVRASELRRRLDEARTALDDRAEFESAEIPVDQAEPAGDPNERRRQVHEHGRATVDQMKADAETHGDA